MQLIKLSGSCNESFTNRVDHIGLGFLFFLKPHRKQLLFHAKLAIIHEHHFCVVFYKCVGERATVLLPQHETTIYRRCVL